MKKIRGLVQAFFFVLIALIAINNTLAEVGNAIPLLSEASLHAICPFGGVVTLYNLATLGTFIQKIHASSVILMSIVFVLSILFGPVFCGWVCPLGTIQEWIGKLGRKIFKKKYNRFVPSKLDKILRYVRYGVLIWVVYVTARSGYLLFAQVDPYNALFTFWSDEVEIPSLIILAITLILSLFVERPWCKYACPYGALLGLTNKIRLFKIRRNTTTCISCNKCTKNCPMNIPVADKEVVTDHQCISCYECTSEKSCPVSNTVDMSIKLKKVRVIKSTTMGIAVLVLIFGGIVATVAMDIWTTTTSKEPVKFTTGEASGEYNPIDIRGSYTFQEVSDLFEIDLNVLYEAFGIPEDTVGTDIQTKDLETLFEESGVEIGNESVQIFVALYKNLPIELDESILTSNAVQLIMDENKALTPEQLDYLNSHSFDISNINIIIDETTEESESGTATESTTETTTETTTEGTTDSTTDEESEPVVNGSATFQKVLDAGVTKEQIEEIIQDTLPATNQTVKDYCIDKGLSFSSIKEQLNALID